MRILVGFATLALIPAARAPIARSDRGAVALLLGVAVRGEQVALVSMVGGAVCVAGAWLAQRAQRG